MGAASSNGERWIAAGRGVRPGWVGEEWGVGSEEWVWVLFFGWFMLVNDFFGLGLGFKGFLKGVVCEIGDFGC